jgi:hypothetical protein
VAQPKDSPKADGSMVVHVTKQVDAVGLLEGQHFDVDSEAGFTRVFEARWDRRSASCV